MILNMVGMIQTPRSIMPDSKHPGVVIEMSYPQKRRHLPRLAYDYFLRSDANICAVVEVDIDYRGKRVTMSTWRPHIEVKAECQEDA
jgi:hypothetical protein